MSQDHTWHGGKWLTLQTNHINIDTANTYYTHMSNILIYNYVLLQRWFLLRPSILIITHYVHSLKLLQLVKYFTLLLTFIFRHTTQIHQSVKLDKTSLAAILNLYLKELMVLILWTSQFIRNIYDRWYFYHPTCLFYSALSRIKECVMVVIYQQEMQLKRPGSGQNVSCTSELLRFETLPLHNLWLIFV